MRRPSLATSGDRSRVTSGGLVRASLLALCGLAACDEERPVAPAPAPPPPSAVASPVRSAVDRLDPNEVIEGDDRAFGLPIPRAMRVHARFADAVHVRGAIPLDALANYVRARVIAEQVETGPAKTVFSRATVKASPEKLLRVEVVAHAASTELVIRDVSRGPSSDVVKPTDPWRQPGFDPRDRRADPKRFE